MTVLGLDPDDLEYGFRASGPYDPARGYRFDPGRVLTDPYARAIGGRDVWGRPVPSDDPYPYRARIVTDPPFDWGDDRPLRTPVTDLVIYETHVRGFTRHPSAAVSAPGTYAGLIEKIPYLRSLGVTCVELMPIFEFDECDTQRIEPDPQVRRHNYWGYSTVAFFAPKASYAADPAHAGHELKRLVRELHRAGMEVMLDVVFNHTAEGNEDGPTISFRGLDNPTWYQLTEDGRYRNFSGTGNTVNANAPVTRSFIVECLRHWVSEYHIDGFRFDLASVLTRGPDGAPLTNPPVLEAIAADPVLRDVRLVAEAWDAAGLYQVGSFPHYGRWSEWNGRYRDTLRRFLRGDPGTAADLAGRLVGSPDLYPRRGPGASVNLVTAHDGFTLHDLVAYNHKHNEANGEDNLDGENENLSWNSGAEGPTDDPAVLDLRARQIRNALLLLLCSHGVPMLVAGDEMGRTQHGNNNAYSQDNEVSWVDWDRGAVWAGLTGFTRNAIAFRRAHPALRPASHVGAAGDAPGRPWVSWHGERTGHPDWSDPRPLVSVTFGATHPDGSPDLVHLVANAHWEDVTVELPRPGAGLVWCRFADTAAPDPAHVPGTEPPLRDQSRLTTRARSVTVLTARPDPPDIGGTP
jgi:glycogen operon protein